MMCCDVVMPVDLAHISALTVELAVEGGRRAREWRAEGFTVSSKSTPTDLVTEVDGRVERWIGAQLRHRRPGDGLVGEEAAADAPGGDGVRWLVDPIDGTVNFTLGLPQYAVSVAAEVDGRVVAGCVANPVSGDVFRAVTGQGAYRQRTDEHGGLRPQTERLTGPREIALDRAVVGTGFGYETGRRARQGEVVARLLPRIGDIRRAGSASLDLCAVAAGWLDAHFEAGLHVWDYAAGLLIATEAGCVSSGLGNRAAGEQFCAVAGAGLGPVLFELLAELGADRVLD